MMVNLFDWCRAWYRYTRQFLSSVYRYGNPPDLAKAYAVDGMMTNGEVKYLYELAQQASGGCIVEIGSFHGRSTTALALGSFAGNRARIFAIDPFINFQGIMGGTYSSQDRSKFTQNLLLAGVADKVWQVHLPSEQASRGWQEPIALLWVDGDHSYAGARMDFQCWESFVIKDGIIAFHDSTNPQLGPYQVIEEILPLGNYELAGRVEKITVLRKK